MKALIVASLMAVGALAGPSVMQTGTYGVACTTDDVPSCKVAFGAATVNDPKYPSEMGNLVYTDGLFNNGWDLVTATLSPEAANTTDAATLNKGYYGMGYVEGYVTYKRIYQNWLNVKSEFEPALNITGVVNWFQQNLQYVQSVTKAGTTTDPYYIKVGNLLQQVNGLAAGYAAGCAAAGDSADVCGSIDETMMHYINWQAEIGDIVTAYAPESEFAKNWQAPENQHCSSLVKVIPDDLFISHIAWTGFSWMMRQYKTYKFEGNNFVTIAGHPGMIHSMDDWYMTGRGLAVTETTIIVDNNALFVQYIKDQYKSIPSYLRAMAANYLADTTAEWMQYFATEQSGTYNNQWISVDMKLYTGDNKNLTAGLLGIMETLPGTYKSGDQTAFLETNQHWPSYNFASYPEIQELANYAGEIAQYGEGMSYNGYNRARIFARDANKVTDLESMEAMMMYNDYKNDPLSLIPNCTGAINNTCNPTHSAMLTISSRGDLNPAGGVDMYGNMVNMVGQRDHGGIDMKLASWKGMIGQPNGALVARIKNGPTTSNGLPIFKFSTCAIKDIPHEGLPDEFNFGVNTFTTYPNGSPATGGDEYDNMGMGAALLIISLVIIVFSITMLVVCKFIPNKYQGAGYTQV